MLFLSPLDRKEQSGAAAAHLQVLPGVMASLCKPKEPQPATTPDFGTGTGLQLQAEPYSRCELPGTLCPCRGLVLSRAGAAGAGEAHGVGWSKAQSFSPAPATRTPRTWRLKQF